MPRELARLLLREERAIQPHEEPVESVNLGTEEDRKEKSRSAKFVMQETSNGLLMIYEMINNKPSQAKPRCLGQGTGP